MIESAKATQRHIIEVRKIGVRSVTLVLDGKPVVLAKGDTLDITQSLDIDGRNLPASIMD